jgi:hypothetical protein
MAILAELWEFIKTQKKFWLLPIIVALLLLGGLLLFVEGSALAPFVYTFF